MFETLTILVIGFSVVSAVVLLFAYLFFLDEMEKSPLGMVACVVMVAALAALQLEHLQFLLTGTDLFETTRYVVLLLTTPPAFYFFSREILLPDHALSPWQSVHLLPVGLGFVLPPGLVAPAAFVLGAGYAVWLARIVHGMRRHVRRFRFEMFFFGFFAVIAVLVLVLVLLIPWIESSTFYIAYAGFIGLALILVTAAMIVFPEMLSDISDAAKLSYAASTLNDVDVEAKLARLEVLMDEDRIYQNENLNLALLAAAMELSSHQLSELINTRFGIGFSRFVRERRVAEAKRLLLDEPGTSVLTIGLAVGFRSQSNFYAAFRDITGEAPGNFRRKRLPAG